MKVQNQCIMTLLMVANMIGQARARSITFRGRGGEVEEERLTRRLEGGKGSTSSSSKSKSGKGSKSKKGKEMSKYYQCASNVATKITHHVPEAVTRNPKSCCKKDYPTAVFVTHAATGDDTYSGFDIFWDTVYQNFESVADALDICFVMTGYDPKLSGDKTLSDILVGVNNVTSTIESVPAMMSTDPTTERLVMNSIREISNRTGGPSIGVFNAGSNNVVVEALVSGKERLPYIGYSDDREYGVEAANASLSLLGSDSATPLCLNARPDILFVGQRCAAFYDEISPADEQPRTGIDCSMSVNVTDVAMTILRKQVNAVFAHSECCGGAAEAVRIARARSRHDIVLGCMDEDTTDGYADFVTKQPIGLQSFHTFAFAAFPVLQAIGGDDARADQFFPSLQTRVEINLFTILKQRSGPQKEGS